MRIRIITTPTKKELFKKVLQEKGDLLRMSLSGMSGKFRMTIVFK